MVLRFFGRTRWDIQRVIPPWGDRPSIHQCLLDQLGAAATSLGRAGVSLPDEDQLRQSGSRLRWVAGALDGVVGHHSEVRDSEEVAGSVLNALRALIEKDTNDRAKAFYSLLTTYSALQYVDALLPLITRSAGVQTDRVRAVARWLATEAPDREAVKAAIALLGVVSSGEDREILLTLGTHDEFTLFSAVALQHTEEHSEPLLWQLARHVTGWGRIHVVERLAGTRDDRIKAWLVREGCYNDIMNEYTALVCAKSGELVSALRSANPDQALMKGAGAILAALIRGGPSEGIEAYSDGPEATELYLAHLRDRETDLEDLNIVAAIERFLADELEPTDDSIADWRARRSQIDDHVAAIKARRDWPSKIQSGLSSDDRSVFANAADAAKLFGLDTWEIYFERLERGEDQWYFVMQTDDPARIDRVVSLAEERLPLKEIGSGPADELGLGPEFRAHSALNFVLQDVRRFPGKGWRLIRTGLQSPVTGNRNMAVRALASWERTAWPPETELVLRHALKDEPNAATREWMRKLLNGEPLQS